MKQYTIKHNKYYINVSIDHVKLIISSPFKTVQYRLTKDDKESGTYFLDVQYIKIKDIPNVIDLFKRICDESYCNESAVHNILTELNYIPVNTF